MKEFSFGPKTPEHELKVEKWNELKVNGFHLEVEKERKKGKNVIMIFAATVTVIVNVDFFSKNLIKFLIVSFKRIAGL